MITSKDVAFGELANTEFKSTMKLILSPKDNCNKMEFEVETFFLEGDTLGVVMPDGTRRNYPLIHLWWYGTDKDSVNENRTRPL